MWDEVVHGVKSENGQIDNLEERREIEMMDSEERSRGAGEENADLIDGIVGWVKGPEVFEGAVLQGKEQGRGNTLIDGVLSNVYQEEWKHADDD